MDNVESNDGDALRVDVCKSDNDAVWSSDVETVGEARLSEVLTLMDIVAVPAEPVADEVSSPVIDSLAEGVGPDFVVE